MSAIFPLGVMTIPVVASKNNLEEMFNLYKLQLFKIHNKSLKSCVIISTKSCCEWRQNYIIKQQPQKTSNILELDSDLSCLTISKRLW